MPLAILVHGMGHTPASMALLASRLRRQGFGTASFGYAVTVERFAACRARLQRFIAARIGDEPYIVIGHSLGSVLLRSVVGELPRPPAASFLLTPPSRPCVWARMLAPRLPYRVLTGEMGQLLADEAFMRALPVPTCPTWIYAGTGGPLGRYWPIGDELNDGVLKVSETRLDGVPLVLVPAIHTFIMNSRFVVRDLIVRTQGLIPDARSGAERR